MWGVTHVPGVELSILHTSFNLPNHPVRNELLLFPFYRWENRLRNLPKITGLINSRAGILLLFVLYCHYRHEKKDTGKQFYPASTIHKKHILLETLSDSSLIQSHSRKKGQCGIFSISLSP